MAQFSVLHIEKSKSGSTGIGNHIERKFVPKNADPNKQHLNEHFIKSNNTLNQDVNDRIAAAVKKTVRKDAVKALNIVLTGSHDRMKEIEKNPKELARWVEDNLAFTKRTFGTENLLRFSLHRDERTPHIHAVVTPITQDGRLSAKEFLLKDSKKGINKLQDMQDEYGKLMNDYGLSRGIKGSRATHDSVKEYYARIENPIESEISIEKASKLIGRGNTVKMDKNALKGLILDFKGYKKQVDEIDDKIAKKEAKLRAVAKKMEDYGKSMEAELNEEKAKFKAKVDRQNHLPKLMKAQERERIRREFEKLGISFEFGKDGFKAWKQEPTQDKKQDRSQGMQR